MLPSWMPRKRWVSRRSDRTRGSGSPLLSPPSWTSSRSNHSRSHPQQQHPQQRWWWWWLLFGIASTLTLLWLWIELTASPFSASLSSSFSSSFSWTPTIPSFSTTTATTTTTNEPETTTATKATTTQRQPSDRILLRPEDERYMKAMLQRQFDWFRNQASTNSNKNYNSSSNNHTTTTNALFPPPVPWHSSPPLSSSSSSSSSPTACAWLLYGLPRSFATMVLPSLVRNIFLPNAHYHCHVYVSYHALTTPYEPSGRSGHGGPIDSRQVFLLQYAVQQVYEFYWHEWRHTVAAADAAADASSSSSSFTSIPPLPPPPPPPTIQFTSYNDEELWQQHGDLLNKTRYAKDEQGRLLYFPWEPGDFVFPTSADNIIRMWHATQSVWELMRQHEQVLWLQQQSSSSSQQQQQRTNKQSPSSLSSSSYYARVAMLRVDVFFISPIDIWQTGQPPRQRDEDNRVAVVPAFAKFPVNDRTFILLIWCLFVCLFVCYIVTNLLG